MVRDDVLNVFRECGALLEGHFLLTSGLHSPRYLQCALVMQDPRVCGELCAQLADKLHDVEADTVIGPAMGGIVLAYELARALGVRGIFMERDKDGLMTLRRGFSLKPGSKVIVAEDVMTTGGSVAEVVAATEEAGATVAAVACLVDRGGLKRFDGKRTASLLQVEAPTYAADDCPLCREGIPLVKPGSRNRPGA